MREREYHTQHSPFVLCGTKHRTLPLCTTVLYSAALHKTLHCAVRNCFRRKTFRHSRREPEKRDRPLWPAPAMPNATQPARLSLSLPQQALAAFAQRWVTTGGSTRFAQTEARLPAIDQQTGLIRVYCICGMRPRGTQKTSSFSASCARVQHRRTGPHRCMACCCMCCAALLLRGAQQCEVVGEARSDTRTRTHTHIHPPTPTPTRCC